MKIINSTEEFKTTITNKKVLVDFYADWCGPCKMIAPVLEDLSNDNLDFEIIEVNVDDAPELAQEFGVMSIPTLIKFDNNAEVARQMGFLDKESIISFME